MYNKGASVVNDKIYSKKEYIIFKVKGDYILYNTKKTFKEGHTHLKNIDIAKMLINCAIKEEIPKTKNKYLLESLTRISKNEKYIEKIRRIKNGKNNI